MSPVSRVIHSIVPLAIALTTLALPEEARAADRWIEVKSQNVTVVASTNAGMARTLLSCS